MKFYLDVECRSNPSLGGVLITKYMSLFSLFIVNEDLSLNVNFCSVKLVSPLKFHVGSMSPFEFEISYCLEVDLCGELILINLSDRNINIHRCAGIFCAILIKICEVIYIYNLKKITIAFQILS